MIHTYTIMLCIVLLHQRRIGDTRNAAQRTSPRISRLCVGT
jgi:hypothetical protein